MNTTNSSQVETDHPLKQRGYRFWLGCFVLLVGMPFLLYYGYCWGWWGRQSLLLQYLFQCNCPPASEETRYPDEVDVIVSACPQARARLAPSGRLLYVNEEKSGIATTYLLNLQTMERIDVTNQPFPSFLTDDLWFVESGIDDYIIDRITGMRYPIQRFVYSRPDAEINGETNLTLLVESLRQAKHVFLIGASQDTVIALTSDFRTDPERNFLTNQFDIPDFNMEQFLRENNIVYQTVLPDFPDEAVSQDRGFVARADGIYVAKTGQKIVEGYSTSRFYRAYSRKYFAVRGWIYDNSGVIYSKFLNPCLIETNFFILDAPGCFIEVSQPVLLLKVPEEYLLPTESP
jgi:hypothetical protein